MKSGYIALIGQPNVGKSTLLNHLVGQKVSITSRRPQTTRHRIVGIKTTDAGQAIYVDTPGIHEGGKNALNRYLNRTARSALAGVDVVIWVTDHPAWDGYDTAILSILGQVNVPVVFVINKIDRISDKERFLPFLQEADKRYAFSSIIPVSALRGVNLEVLEKNIMEILPEGDRVYPVDQITDRSERFVASEIIREKLTRLLVRELPYRLTVEIDNFKAESLLVRIGATIWVERDSQKAIVIGKKGMLLKKVGQMARKDLEKMLDNKVFLQLWVKVKKGWSDSERALQSLGYD